LALDKVALFEGLAKYTGVCLSSKARDSLEESVQKKKEFEFLLYDIHELIPTVKYMHLIDFAAGMYALSQVTNFSPVRQLLDCRNQNEIRLLSFAKESLNRLVIYSPTTLRLGII